MTTVQELISEVRDYLSEPSSGLVGEQLFSDNELLSHFKRSITEICSRTDVNYKSYTYTAVGSETSLTFSALTGSVETELLYLDKLLFLAVDSVGTDNYFDLYRVSLTDYKNTGTNSGTDIKDCVIYGNTIYFNQSLDAGDIIVISGKWLDTSVTATTSTYPFGKLAEETSIYRVMYLALMKKQQLENAASWKGLYDVAMNDLIVYYKKFTDKKYPYAVQAHKTPNSIFQTKSLYTQKPIVVT